MHARFCAHGAVCADNALLAELRVAAGDPPNGAKQAWTDVGRLSQGHRRDEPGAPGRERVDVGAVARAVQVLGAWLFG